MLDLDIERTLRQISSYRMALSDVLSFLASALMIVGGVIPYIPQYIEIKRTKNADGFSTFVCLILLIANTLRILFWFGHRFELPLLVQSFLMNIAMLVMVHICVTVRRKSDISGRQHLLSDMQIEDFWQWTDFGSYLWFMVIFTVVVGLVTYVFLNFSLFVETLGLCALLTEAMLGVPQFYRNYDNQSTAGMSVKMVMLWACGDIFKTTYFVWRHAPLQFWMCGGLQVLLDFSIMFQVLYYDDGHGRKRSLSPSTSFTSVVAH